MRGSPSLAVSLTVSLVLVGCGEDPVAPGPDTGPLTAYVDGALFVADHATVTREGDDLVAQATASDGKSIGFRFTDQGPANYLVGPGNPVSASVTIGSSRWVAEGTTGRGTITVTALFPTQIRGSFNLTVVGGPDESSLSVTQGQFLIDFLP